MTKAEQTQLMTWRLKVLAYAGAGGDFRAPLGITVIGGVVTSTLLTLLVIPTVYEILADSRDWILARFRGGRGTASKARVTSKTEGFEHPSPLPETR